VIRGPGATLWEPMRRWRHKCHHQEAKSLSPDRNSGSWNEERALAEFVMVETGRQHYYRAYTKYSIGTFSIPIGMTAHDGWDALRGGFRADWTRPELIR